MSAMLLNPFWGAAAGGEPSPVPFASVVFLSGFEGADGSSAFVDESSYAHAILAVGSPTISTAQAKFGSSSLRTQPTNLIRCADVPEFEMGAGAFTLEGWFRFVSISASLERYGGLICKGAIGQGSLSYALHLDPACPTNPGIKLELSSNGFTAHATIQAEFAFSLDTWYHIAADRDGAGVCRVYIDGVMVASGTSTITLHNNNDHLYIGRWAIDPASRTLNGYHDEVRVTKGVAVYGTDAGFTPPTAAFPRS